MKATPRIVLALLLEACSCDEPPAPVTLESDVDVPLHVHDLDDWAAAREATSTVDRSLAWRSASGGACHGAACFIVFPAILGASLIPRIDTTYVVAREEVVLFAGGYDRSGDLVVGRLRDGDVIREVGRIDREALDLHAVVVVATVDLEPDGSEGARHDIPIREQIDLASRYDARLASDPRGTRAPLLTEMLESYDEALIAAAVENLRESRDDRETAAVLRALCERAYLMAPPPRAGRVITALETAPGVDSGTVAVAACYQLDIDPVVMDRFIEPAVRARCTEGPLGRFTMPEGDLYRDRVRALIHACPASTRRTALLVQYGEDVPPEDLRAAVLAHRDALVAYLDLHVPEERSLAFDSLSTAQRTSTITTLFIQREFLGELATPEVDALVDAYLAAESPHDHQQILDILAPSRPHTLSAHARAAIEARADDVDAQALALVAGDPVRALAVARSVDGPIAFGTGGLPPAHMVRARALVLAGCTETEVPAVVAAARTAETVPTCVH